jgi:hypothetical protein
VATYGSKVYVIWVDAITDDIYLTRSTNDGTSWLASQNLTVADSNEHDMIRVAAYNNNVYIVWAQSDTVDDEDVVFIRSTDSGVTWSAPFILWNNTGSARDVSVAAYGSNVYVVMDDSTIGPLQRKSTNSGASFGAPTSIGNGDDRQPEVDATAAYTGNGCNVYLSSLGIYVSTGPGTQQNIGTISPSTNSCQADIGANDTNDMHVVYNSWDGSNKHQIYYCYSSSPPGPGGGDIPTVSEWGLIIMAALLMAAGAVVILRRRRVAT